MNDEPRILIVDDGEGTRQTLSLIFGKQGYEIETAATGREALEKAQERFFNLALLDIKLPDMAGIELIAPLKEMHPDMEVLMVTAYASTETAVQALNEGASAYITKPLNMDEVLAVVREALEKQRLVMEKRRAEEALRESEEWFRELVESANDVIYTHDLQGNFSSANPAATRIYGYTNEEILQLNIADIVDPEHLPLARQKIREKLNGPAQTGPYELLTYSKAGEPIWVEVSTRLLEREGQPLGVLGIARDITDRKRAEEALRESEAHLQGLFETMAEGMIFTAPDGQIVQANPAAERILGLKRSNIEARNYVAPEWEIFRLDGTPMPPEEMAGPRAMREKRLVKNVVMGAKRPDGSITWINVSAAPVMTESGELEGVVGTFADITERKQAEEELQHTTETLRKILGATIQAMAFTVETRDAYTAGHQRQVADLARAIATEMGLSKERIEGIRTAAVIHDIGKITVPTDILNKPTKLSEHEFGIMKDHPQTGYEILKKIDFPWPVAEIVFQHHERMDGSGYPQGLSGEEIILEARILAVADVVEAMASHRPYRPARGIDQALEEISQNRGVLYDAEVVDACLKLFTEKGFEFK